MQCRIISLMSPNCNDFIFASDGVADREMDSCQFLI